MFLDELSPLLKKVTQQPIAFMGGFFSGILRLSPAEDPLRTWLQGQGEGTTTSGTSPAPEEAPQKIDIE